MLWGTFLSGIYKNVQYFYDKDKINCRRRKQKRRVRTVERPAQNKWRFKTFFFFAKYGKNNFTISHIAYA